MNEEKFSQLNRTLDIASQSNGNLLGGLVILTAIFTEFCVAELICAEADKIEYALSNTATVSDLAELDNSVANVLAQLCCIEAQVNAKIAQGIELRA